MGRAKITNCETGDTKEVEIEIEVGAASATVSSGAARLYEAVGDWSPQNVGGVEFDLKTENVRLRRCIVTGNGSVGIRLSFMDRE